MFELDRVRRAKLPPASIAVGVVTLIAFGLEQIPELGLIQLGGSQRVPIWTDHQVWRLVTPVFLHANVMHIAMNGYSFVLLAPFVERIWGWARFLIVYVISGIAGAVLSSKGSDAFSVGASGALFGLVGFLIAAAYAGAHKHEVRAIVRGTWGQGLFISLGLAALWGFRPGSNIDNLAHLGGLLVGGGLGLMLVETEENDPPTLVMGIASALAIVAAFAALGWDARERSRYDAILKEALQLFRVKDYEGAARCYEQALVLRPRSPVTPAICEAEGEAYLAAGKLDEAAITLERAWRLNPTPTIALQLIEVSLRRKKPKEAQSWAREWRTTWPGPVSVELRPELENLLGLAPDEETRAAIAAIGSS